MRPNESTLRRVAEWCPDVADLLQERDTLRGAVEAGRRALLEKFELDNRAQIRGYDSIQSAIEAAPLKSAQGD